MTQQEISEAYSSCLGVSADSMPLQNADINDIDIIKVKEYITQARQSGRKKFENDDPRYVLEKLGLIKND